jgi:Protein of unknown function (DUF1566)
MQQQREKRWSLGLIAGCVLATTIGATGPAQAASGNGPYYAEPSWSQKLPAATRFVVLTDWNSEAVLDRNTGLVWEKSPDMTRTTWDVARETCVNRSVGGQKGWRLPSVHELASLIDPSVAFPDPKLQAGHPFTNVQPANYWSATTTAGNLTSAWNLNFFNGFVFALNKPISNHVWCVRGGNNADAY